MSANYADSLSFRQTLKNKSQKKSGTAGHLISWPTVFSLMVKQFRGRKGLRTMPRVGLSRLKI